MLTRSGRGSAPRGSWKAAISNARGLGGARLERRLPGVRWSEKVGFTESAVPLRSVDSLARLCDSRDAVYVNPRLVGIVLAHALALPDPMAVIVESIKPLFALCVTHGWTDEIGEAR